MTDQQPSSDGLLRLPPDGEDFDWHDLKNRVALLLQRYGCEPTLEGWRSLALQIAIRRSEPGFVLSVPKPVRTPRQDEQNQRDEMIEAHLNPPEGSKIKRCKSVAEAARQVENYLRKQWKLAGEPDGQEPPSWKSLVSQFSTRNAGKHGDDPRKPPGKVVQYLRELAVFQAVEEAACRIAARRRPRRRRKTL